MSVSIFTFLSDQYQHELKQCAEKDIERFESVMKEYKKIFSVEFNSLVNINQCTELNNKIHSFKVEDKEKLYDWLNCLQESISKDFNSILEFIDNLIDIYITYQKGKITFASVKLYNLLSKNSIFDNSLNFKTNYPVTFRGRIDSNCSFTPNKKKNESYFYHIPFNSLNYVKNYRFSITGQPFIYLGASIPTVQLELRTKLKNINLSIWGIKPDSSLKLFDISNAFYDLINLNIIPIFKASSGLTCHDQDIIPNKNTFLIDFKKFIISQFCTFKKKEIKDQYHIEQYVLPQLLTEQIRNYNNGEYTGIIFPSTQYFDKIASKRYETYYGLFKNNIALFTEYSENELHDSKIIENFEIIPIDKKALLDKNSFVSKIDKAINLNSNNIRIKVILKLLADNYDKMLYNSKSLTEIKMIKIQFSAIINYLKRI